MKNPPAFPQSRQGPTQGTTLRDYFAAKAMAAMIGNPYTGEQYHKEGFTKEEQKQGIVKNAYEVADAMLEERQKEAQQ